jgi:signal transduction histidine kinase
MLFVSTTAFVQTDAALDSLLKIDNEAIQTKSAATIQALLKALNAPKAKHDKKIQAKLHSLLSLANYYHGDYSANTKHALKAIRLYEEVKDFESLAYLYGEFGFLLKKRDVKEAETYLIKGLLLSEKNKFDKPLLSIYNNYGVVKSQLNQQDSALYYFQKGLTLKLKVKDTIGIPYSYNNIGELYLSQKKYTLAEKQFENALTYAINNKDNYTICDTYAYFGDLYLAQNNFTQAIFYFNQSLALATKFKISNLKAHNYRMLAKAYEGSDNYQKALDFSKMSQAFDDSLLNIQTQSKMLEYQVRFETVEKEKELLNQKVLSKQRQFTIFILILAIALVIFLFLIRYRTLKRRNARQKLEFELLESENRLRYINKLHEQRVEISKDLHDNIGSQLTFIISSMEMLKYRKQKIDDDTLMRIQVIEDFARETIAEFRDTVWALNRDEISLEDMRSRISTLVLKAKKAAENVEIEFDFTDQILDFKFESFVGMNIFRIVQEAINNALKYAKASTIRINVSSESGNLVFSVIDDGVGFDIEATADGNGLNYMRKRAMSIHATINVDSKINQGTTITLNIPLNKA